MVVRKFCEKDISWSITIRPAVVRVRTVSLSMRTSRPFNCSIRSSRVSAMISITPWALAFPAVMDLDSRTAEMAHLALR